MKFRFCASGTGTLSIEVGAAAVWVGRAGGLDRAFLAVLPVALACILVILFRLPPRRLRWLGWSMVIRLGGF